MLQEQNAQTRGLPNPRDCKVLNAKCEDGASAPDAKCKDLRSQQCKKQVVRSEKVLQHNTQMLPPDFKTESDYVAIIDVRYARKPHVHITICVTATHKTESTLRDTPSSYNETRLNTKTPHVQRKPGTTWLAPF